jgi:fatty acid desaturase
MTAGIIDAVSERKRRRGIEWPTVALAVAIYSGWLAITYWHASMPWWLAAALGAWFVAWHSSLQHEVLHGHPTRWRAVNKAIGYVPLALWIPYERYRATHLTHHNDERLTDPLDDPESRYWSADAWARLSPIGQRLVRAQATVLGRILIGPFWAIWTFWVSEARAVRDGDLPLAKIWAIHVVSVAIVLTWVVGVCGMGMLAYVGLIALPGTSLMLIRSFAEHRANRAIEHRTAIVEGSWLLGPLYLFNNLHAAHHARPDLAWYRLPGWYAQNRARLIAGNGGLVYRGYRDLFARFFFRPHDAPLHPLGRAPQRDIAS